MIKLVIALTSNGHIMRLRKEEIMIFIMKKLRTIQLIIELIELLLIWMW